MSTPHLVLSPTTASGVAVRQHAAGFAPPPPLSGKRRAQHTKASTPIAQQQQQRQQQQQQRRSAAMAPHAFANNSSDVVGAARPATSPAPRHGKSTAHSSINTSNSRQAGAGLPQPRPVDIRTGGGGTGATVGDVRDADDSNDDPEVLPWTASSAATPPSTTPSTRRSTATTPTAARGTTVLSHR